VKLCLSTSYRATWLDVYSVDVTASGTRIGDPNASSSSIPEQGLKCGEILIGGRPMVAQLDSGFSSGAGLGSGVERGLVCLSVLGITDCAGLYGGACWSGGAVSGGGRTIADAFVGGATVTGAEAAGNNSSTLGEGGLSATVWWNGVVVLRTGAGMASNLAEAGSKSQSQPQTQFHPYLSWERQGRSNLVPIVHTPTTTLIPTLTPRTSSIPTDCSNINNLGHSTTIRIPNSTALADCTLVVEVKAADSYATGAGERLIASAILTGPELECYLNLRPTVCEKDGGSDQLSPSGHEEDHPTGIRISRLPLILPASTRGTGTAPASAPALILACAVPPSATNRVYDNDGRCFVLDIVEASGLPRRATLTGGSGAGTAGPRAGHGLGPSVEPLVEVWWNGMLVGETSHPGSGLVRSQITQHSGHGHMGEGQVASSDPVFCRQRVLLHTPLVDVAGGGGAVDSFSDRDVLATHCCLTIRVIDMVPVSDGIGISGYDRRLLGGVVLKGARLCQFLIGAIDSSHCSIRDEGPFLDSSWFHLCSADDIKALEEAPAWTSVPVPVPLSVSTQGQGQVLGLATKRRAGAGARAEGLTGAELTNRPYDALVEDMLASDTSSDLDGLVNPHPRGLLKLRAGPLGSKHEAFFAGMIGPESVSVSGSGSGSWAADGSLERQPLFPITPYQGLGVNRWWRRGVSRAKVLAPPSATLDLVITLHSCTGLAVTDAFSRTKSYVVGNWNGRPVFRSDSVQGLDPQFGNEDGNRGWGVSGGARFCVHLGVVTSVGGNAAGGVGPLVLWSDEDHLLTPDPVIGTTPAKATEPGTIIIDTTHAECSFFVWNDNPGESLCFALCALYSILIPRPLLFTKSPATSSWVVHS